MQDVIDIGAKPLARSQVANVAFNNAGASPLAYSDFDEYFVEIFLVAGRKIVQSEDELIELKKSFENVRADETSDARDEPGARSSAKMGLQVGIEPFVVHRGDRNSKSRSAAEFGGWDA